MSLIDNLNRVLNTLDAITSRQWGAGLEATLQDIRANSNIEKDILDGLKAILPQYAIIADLAELYFAAGGEPAPNSALVFQRRDEDDMNRDV